MKKIIFLSTFFILPILVIRNFIGKGIITYIDFPFPFNIDSILKNSLQVWSTVNKGNYTIIDNVYWLQIGPIYKLLKVIGINDSIASQIIFIFPLILFMFSSYLLIRFVIGRESIKQDFYSLFFTVLLFLSPNIIQSLSYGWTTNAVLQLSAGMVSIYLFLKYLDERRIHLLVFSILLTLISSFLLQYQFSLSALLLLIVIFKKDKFAYKAFLGYVFGFIMVNFFWIFNYIYSSNVYGVSHYKFDPITSILSNSTFNNIIRTLTLRNTQSEQHIFLFQVSSIMSIIQLILILLAFFFILKYKNKINNTYYLPLFIFILIFWNLSRGGSSALFLFLLKYVPFFTIFRDVFKLTAYINLAITLLAAISILPFYSKIKDLKLVKYSLIFIILILTIINSWPLLSGTLGGVAKDIQLPQDYKDYLISEKSTSISDGNVLILPMPAWFSKIDWAKDVQVSNPLRTIMPERYIYDEFNNINLSQDQNELINTLYSSDDVNENYIIEKIKQNNINKIIIQKDQKNRPLGLENIPNQYTVINIEKNINSIFIKSNETENLVFYDIDPKFKTKIIDLKDQNGNNVNYNITKSEDTSYNISFNSENINSLKVVLNQNYNKGWELNYNNCLTGQVSSTNNDSEATNNWIIDSTKECKNSSLSEIKIDYKPQKLFNFGIIISLVSLVSLILLIINSLRRR